MCPFVYSLIVYVLMDLLIVSGDVEHGLFGFVFVSKEKEIYQLVRVLYRDLFVRCLGIFR